jgi:hypothetical protein
MRKILDILGIVLPALIILVSIFRPSLKTITQKAGRARLVNSLVMLFAVILLLAGLVKYLFFAGGGGSRIKDKGDDPIAVSKHSPAFNQSIQSMLDVYYNMSEAFVNWDSAAVTKQAGELKTVLNEFNIDELKVDSNGIYESALDPLATMKTATEGILAGTSFDNKKLSFRDLSDNIRLLFIVVKYDANKVYWLECPMALGENTPANWLSKTDAIRNPYLGLHHPQHKGEMVTCGEVKEVLDYMAKDTTGTRK